MIAKKEIKVKTGLLTGLFFSKYRKFNIQTKAVWHTQFTSTQYTHERQKHGSIDTEELHGRRKQMRLQR